MPRLEPPYLVVSCDFMCQSLRHQPVQNPVEGDTVNRFPGVKVFFDLEVRGRIAPQQETSQGSHAGPRNAAPRLSN